MMESTKSIRVQVPINIALIKYWGKRNSSLILPLNDSLSVTIDELHATSTIEAHSSAQLGKDSVKVNEKDYEVVENDKNAYWRCFSEARKLINDLSESKVSRKRSHPDSENKPPSINWSFTVRFHFGESTHYLYRYRYENFPVTSSTNFPVESGLASSAAGFAAIAYGIGQLFGFGPKEMTRLARIGSGSASRSLDPGFVQWYKGFNDDGSDSFAESILTESDWFKSLCAIIVVTSQQRKWVGSTAGMQSSVRTSDFLQSRLEKLPKRINDLRNAIVSKDFTEFAEIIMQDSNQLHAICLDTKPSLMYMNDNSRHLIQLATLYNNESSLNNGERTTRVAYTFDAGPNCCFITQRCHAEEFVSFLRRYCGGQSVAGNGDDSQSYNNNNNGCVADADADRFSSLIKRKENVFEKIILSDIGGPPNILSSSSSEQPETTVDNDVDA